VERYCPACGQARLDGRHTVRGLIRGAFARLFNLERGLTHTMLRLTLEPGAVVRDFLGGRTAVYVHPFAYLILAFALFALTNRFFPIVTGGDDRVFVAVATLFLAVASRLVFRRHDLNFAEHLILNAYVSGHAVVLVVPSLVLTHLGSGWSGIAAVPIAALVGAGAYFVWAYTCVFPSPRLRSALGGAAVLVLGIALWLLALVATMMVLRPLLA
jgi:hypothetical protein